ncbi:MAG: phosphoenolpyruvate synthase, partial [Bacteroidota bacterium]
FAGQHESYLNISGEAQLLDAIKRCFVSLYTDRAIRYRQDQGFGQMDVLLSAGVQLMVRADKACSGVAFTIDPDSGFRDMLYISGVWGLGENLVQGTVNPDVFLVFKPTLREGKQAIVHRSIGDKHLNMVFRDDKVLPGEQAVRNLPTPEDKRIRAVLDDAQITQLAQWLLLIETHYQMPMDVEWALDGEDGTLYILQARPETVHSSRNPYLLTRYRLQEAGSVLCEGNAIGSAIAAGTARLLEHPSEGHLVQPGDIIVTDLTNPDWDPVLKKAAGIVTNRGGRTSHASIVARELGVPAIVGTGNATTSIVSGQSITLDCSSGQTGKVHDGRGVWLQEELDLKSIPMPNTAPMLILGDPEQAMSLAAYPSKGVGLLRMEFIISNSIRIHPMALLHHHALKDQEAKKYIDEHCAAHPDKKQYFIQKLSEAVGLIAAAFHPRDVVVRMSDFKSNEYANLIGGSEFEQAEENPMLGFRGAARYLHPAYSEAFGLECAAMKKVREEMGLRNVKLMIPFCRTPEEGQAVLDLMASHGLKRGEQGLQVLVMCEIPSNVLLAKEFARLFDGFSIGSNDLTQLTLGIDRDNATLAPLFHEHHPALRAMIALLMEQMKGQNFPVGLCGQAPSDIPEFTKFLVAQGLSSISFNPDALLRGITLMNEAERHLKPA